MNFNLYIHTHTCVEMLLRDERKIHLRVCCSRSFPMFSHHPQQPHEHVFVCVPVSAGINVKVVTRVLERKAKKEGPRDDGPAAVTHQLTQGDRRF